MDRHRRFAARSGRLNGGTIVRRGDREPIWFLGTYAQPLIDGPDNENEFALWEGVMPRRAAPPLHSHPQAETFYVVEGEVTIYIVPEAEIDEPDEGQPPRWLESHAVRLGPGDVASAAGGMPHSFFVESDTARLLFLSTPAGIEGYRDAFAEQAQWPWLPAPTEGPRIAAEKMADVERKLGMVRHGPSPAAFR